MERALINNSGTQLLERCTCTNVRVLTKQTAVPRVVHCRCLRDSDGCRRSSEYRGRAMNAVFPMSCPAQSLLLLRWCKSVALPRRCEQGVVLHYCSTCRRSRVSVNRRKTSTACWSGDQANAVSPPSRGVMRFSTERSKGAQNPNRKCLEIRGVIMPT